MPRLRPFESKFDQLYSDLNGVVATIGPFCSDNVAAVTATEWRAGADISTVVLSPSSTAPILANVGAYPNLLRLSSNDKHVHVCPCRTRRAAGMASHLRAP